MRPRQRECEYSWEQAREGLRSYLDTTLAVEISFSLFLVIPVFCYWTQEKDLHNKDGIETTQDFFPHKMHVTSMTYLGDTEFTSLYSFTLKKKKYNWQQLSRSKWVILDLLHANQSPRRLLRVLCFLECEGQDMTEQAIIAAFKSFQDCS